MSPKEISAGSDIRSDAVRAHADNKSGFKETIPDETDEVRAIVVKKKTVVRRR